VNQKGEAMLRPIVYGLTCLAIACATLAAGNEFDGVYVGARLPTKGSTPPCAPRESVSVTITGDELRFTNSKLQNFGLTFDPNPDGSFDMTYEDVGGTTVDIRGRVAKGVLDAHVVNYGTACEYQWHLEKKQARNSN
jgi:hypothetical protein